MTPKRLFKSVQAIALVIAMIAVLTATPLMSVFAEGAHTQPGDGKVYAYHPDPAVEWDMQTVHKDIAVESGKTYIFSILWKTGDNDHTSVEINGTQIVAGGYNIVNENASYNPYTGRLSYTFLSESDTLKINFENRGEDIKRKDYTIADPRLYQADENGRPILDTEVDCDVDFCSWNTSVWGDPTPELAIQPVDETYFITASKDDSHTQPEGQVWVFSYKNSWDKRVVKYNATAIAGKRYTFSMLWKDLGNSQTVIAVDEVKILDGGYDTINGASFDPYTGRLSYTFVAKNSVIEISIDNCEYGDGKNEDEFKYNKNYAFADPQMYEVNSNGEPVVDGDVVDCDVDLCSDKWLVYKQDYSLVEDDDSGNITVTEGNAADFVIRSAAHAQTPEDENVYAVSYTYSYDQRQLTHSTFVFKNRTYTCSMLYRTYGNSTTRILVDGTRIINGNYNLENGAQYDPYTGILSYTFTPKSNIVEISLDNLGADDTEKYHSYKIADPQLVETDAQGNILPGGDVADCDVDFCEWRSWNWNNEFDISQAIETVKKTEFELRHNPPHAQPLGGRYVLSYDWNMWDAASLIKTVFVFKDRTYTFKAIWNDEKGNAIFKVDGTTVMDAKQPLNGAKYDSKTGVLSYTFTASSYNVEINIDNLDDERKNHCYSISNPQMYESDESGNPITGGDIADCDVDFCEWEQYGWFGVTESQFTITVVDDLQFAGDILLGDANGDGAFNIIDLIVVKKAAIGENVEINMANLGHDAYDTAENITAADLIFIKNALLALTNIRTKPELASLISTLHNTDGYALGFNIANDIKIAKSVEKFEQKTDEKPAYIDFDMCALPYIDENKTNYVVAQTAKFANDGGFIALTSHWLDPTKKLSESSNAGANNSRCRLTAEQYVQVYTPGNDLYNNFREELAIEAAFINQLNNLGINVIYRPLHENNYGSFWWCSNFNNNITPEMTAKLYNYVHDYFTDECGLDNIIWQFNIDASCSTSDLISPDNVDILSIDCYPSNNNFHDIADDYYYLQQACGDKPVAVSEFFSSDSSAHKNLASKLEELTVNLPYKIAYVGIYCNIDLLNPLTLPGSALMLDDIANI